MDLHAALGAEDGALAGEELGLRGQARDRAAAVHRLGGGEGEALGGGDRGGHLGEHEPDRLEAGDRLAELLALLGVGAGGVEGPLGGAEAERGDRDPPAVEDLQRLDEPLADVAQQVVLADEAVLHDHLGGVGGPDAELVLFLAGAETRHAAVEHESGDVVVARTLGVGDREHDTDVAFPAVGGEGLGAVEHPAALDPLGARAGAGGVRSRPRLGQAPGADLLARGQRGQPAAPLLVIAILVDVVAAQRVMGGHADADRRIDARQLGDHQDVFDVAQPGAAVLLGKQDAEEAELSGLEHHLARETLALVDLVDDRVNLLARESSCGFLNGALLVGEGKIHSVSFSLAMLHRVGPPRQCAPLASHLRDKVPPTRAQHLQWLLLKAIFFPSRCHCL